MVDQVKWWHEDLMISWSRQIVTHVEILEEV
jgi:hypothetical protein